MRQPDDGDLHRLSSRRAVGLCQLRCEGVLVVNVQLQEGDHADHRNAAPLLEHDNAGIKNGLIPAKFVDNKTFKQGLFIGLQQHLCAQKLREDAAAVNIPRQKDRGSDRLREAHVDDIILFQIDLGGASRAFDHDDVVLRGERLVGLQDHGHQALFIGKIFAGVHIPQNLSLHDDLGSRIGRRF